MQNISTPGRPLGITLIATLLFIQAVIGIIFGIVTLLQSVFTNWFVALLVGWIPLGIVALLFVLAQGLWTLKPWAYWVTLVLEGLNIVSNLIDLGQRKYSLLAIVSSLIISTIVVVYLLVDGKVRRAFHVGAGMASIG